MSTLFYFHPIRGKRNKKKFAIRNEIENENSHKEKKKRKSNYYFHLYEFFSNISPPILD
jgi:hypothetical protein